MIFKLYFLIFIMKTQIHLSEQITDYNQELKNRIEKSIDTNIDPCVDFYQYSCNNYYNTNPQYDEITGLIDYEVNKKLIVLMENKQNAINSDGSYKEKLRKYYKSCRSIQRRNLTKYFEDIKPADDLNWPILEEVERNKNSTVFMAYEWPQDFKFDFMNLLGRLQSYGLNNVLINQEILLNKNGTYKIVLEPAYYEGKKTLPEKPVLQVFLMNLGLKPRNIVKHVKILQNMDEKWLEIIQNYTKIESNTYIRYQDLSEQYPKLNLKIFLQHLLLSKPDNNTLVLIKYPQYFQYLNDKLWQKLEKQHLCNYLMFKFLYYLAIDSTSDFSSFECIKDLRNKMDLAANYLYYENFFKPEEEKYIKEINIMINQIKNAINLYLQDNELNLSVKQIQKLKTKLNQIRVNIGNLPGNQSLPHIEEFYKNIPPLNEGNYYKNHLNLLKHRFGKSLPYAQNQSFFITPNNHFGSTSVPVYVPLQNMVIIPLGSLQYPLFHYDFNPLYKWSLMGFILSHEFVHAFDTTTQQFDSNGSILPFHSNLWNTRNPSNYLNCIQNQKSTDSIDERIADLFAIRIVYKIYKDFYISADSLNSNYWKRDFFRNLAQFFCGKKDIKFINHDDDAVRLQQIVMNSKEFSEAFGCPENTKMNPLQKCWLT